MLIKSIFMELRSRLRSCNVYITTGVDFTKNCNLKISIQSNCIVLNYYDDNDKIKRSDSLSSIESLSDCYSEEEYDVTSTIPIEEFCQIIPNSMSCLKIDKNTISFRILTEPRNGGNFYNELLTSNTSENASKSNDIKINLKIHNELKITCANCSNTISESLVKFDRILELPSTNMDMSEWFCHGHGHNSHIEPVLKSNKHDFLYRLTSFVVNNTVLSEKSKKFNSKREIYHCNRCLAWLGIKNKDSVKLFNSEVTINQDNMEKRVFIHKTSTDDLKIDDFIFTIEKLTQEFNLGLQYTMMCKIILECTISTTNKQYLLIWVMDKELQVLRSCGEHIDSDKIKLQSCLLTKILYKIELSLNDEVEAWLSDPGVVSTDISKNMFCRGIEHLQNMSLKVPELFRNANGYCVSYLKV
ncbi:uncharacterized protein LOC131841549 [Achroia grisella]|uniref:uncharacterized protein LOC131841549 n=1 Tax=Achroia grisella TaxID=688607 RepID=UPI0027D288BD|nr:uncharacterized protein LOC131841549 [Achroia grisella]